MNATDKLKIAREAEVQARLALETEATTFGRIVVAGISGARLDEASERMRAAAERWTDAKRAIDQPAGEAWVVAHGNPFDGLYLEGPFQCFEDALDEAQSADGDWNIVTMYPPS